MTQPPPGFKYTGYSVYADKASGHFDIRGSMLIPRMWAAAVTDGTYIYVMGGSNNGNSVDSLSNALQIYNTVTNTWAHGTNMIHGVMAICAMVYNGYIYAYGGSYGGGKYLQRMQVYSIKDNKWFDAGTIPDPVGGASVIIHNDFAYFVGGQNPQEHTSPVNAYGLKSGAWSKLPTMQPKLASPGFGVINGSLFMFGGTTDFSQVNQNVSFTPAGNSFNLLVPFPEIVLYPSADVYDGQLWITGGITQSYPNASGMVYRYDPVSNVLNRFPTSLTYPRVGSCTVVVGQTIYVIGGSNALNGVASNVNESLNLAASKFFLMQKA
jgi:N-acetylneuraminic acid mutarotase